jgi:hypothetical protein
LTALPRRAGAAVAGLLLVGALAAGFLDASPAWVRIVAALAGLIVAPALLLAPRVSRLAEWALPGGVMPVSVIAALSLHAFAAAGFALSGAPFSLYATIVIWGLLAAFCACAVAGMRSRAGSPLRAGGYRARRAIGALVLLAGVAALVAPRYTGLEDAFDHMGYVRRVISLDDMRPDGVLALPGDAARPLPADPRKGAFHDVVALVSDLAVADPVQVWSLLRLLMYPLGVLAFTGFAALFARGPAMLLCMALFLVSYAGTTFRFADASAYGQGLAATWYWTLAVLALSGGTRRRVRSVALALVAAGGVLVHLGVALHAAVLAASMILFAGMLALPRAAVRRDALWLAGGAGVALAVRTLGQWGAGPANVIHAHVQGVLTVTDHWFVMSPMEILRQHGLVFLGGVALLPFTVLAARTDARARAALALSIIPVCVAFVPPLATLAFRSGSYMAFRSLLNAPLLPAAAITIVWMVGAVRTRGLLLRVAATLVLVGWSLLFVGPSLRAFGADLGRLSRPETDAMRPRPLDTVAAGLPVGATILADPVTAYRLSAFTSHRFVAILQQHANPGDPWALDRLDAVRDVLSPFAIPQSAVEACRRYSVDFVVLSGREWGIAADYMTPGRPDLYAAAQARLHSMPDSFREFARGDDFVVLHFDPDAREVNDFPGVRAPVETARGPAARCRIPVPDDRFEVTGFSVTPAVVSPGDSLEIAFGYRRDVVSRFGADVVFHIRFDHESVAAAPSVPGDKYVRRLRERLVGRRFRFRADVVAGHGIYEPDIWPMGTPLVERFRVAVPWRAAPGSYRVEVVAVAATMLPNFDITDLVFNRDHYSGVECGTLEVRAEAAR